MDITPYLDLRIAPRAVFDTLAERRDRAPASWSPTGDGRLARRHVGRAARQIRDVALFLAPSGLEAGERACVFAPNRVEWMSAALGIQAAGGVMVPDLRRRAPPTRRRTSSSTRDARVVFVDTPALVARVLAGAGRVRAPSSASCCSTTASTSRGSRRAARRRARRSPPYAAIERKIVAVVAARSRWAARATRRTPGAFERTMDGVSLDQPGLMLYTSGTTRQPQGRPAHAPQRRRQRARLAQVQRAAPRRGRRSISSGCR